MNITVIGRDNVGSGLVLQLGTDPPDTCEQSVKTSWPSCQPSPRTTGEW
jgi:hypothetical protein